MKLKNILSVNKQSKKEVYNAAKQKGITDVGRFKNIM